MAQTITMGRVATGVAAGGALAGLVASLVARRKARDRRVVCSEVLSPPECEALHRGKVQRIARQLATRTSTKPVSLRKRAVPHQVPKKGDVRRRDEKIDVGDLTSILHVDPVARTCTAESGVTFVDLVEATMRYGLVPIVVPEFKEITIGGAVSGCSIESTSFRYGGFHDTCLEYEVVTASGEILRCAPDGENPLLFQMMHGSFGTLGILTKLVFRLMPAKPYVKMEYERYSNIHDYQAAIRRRYEAQDVDFMDGILHSPTELVLSLGRFVDEAPYANRYDWMKVYCWSTRTRTEDYLRTPDYFFRYDRGVTNPRPRSWLGRLLFGRVSGSSQMLGLAEKLHFLLSDAKPTITLDVFIPISRMPEFLEWYGKEMGHFPLWCVPYRRVRDYEWIAPELLRDVPDPLYVDLAIYGMKQHGERNLHRVMEEALPRFCGLKTLISHNYYPEEEFWRTFNRENYQRVKAQVDPKNVFRDLYTKTCKAAMGYAS